MVRRVAPHHAGERGRANQCGEGVTRRPKGAGGVQGVNAHRPNMLMRLCPRGGLARLVLIGDLLPFRPQLGDRDVLLP